MIFTHGGVLKLPAFGQTRFLHGECRKYFFNGEKMILDTTYNVDQHIIPNEQLSLLKAKDMKVVDNVKYIERKNDNATTCTSDGT